MVPVPTYLPTYLPTYPPAYLPAYRSQNFIDPDGDGDTPYADYKDTIAMKPSHQMCLYGWPRHAYMMHEGRLPLTYMDGNVTRLTRLQTCAPRLQPYAPRLQPLAPRLQPYAPRLQP